MRLMTRRQLAATLLILVLASYQMARIVEFVRDYGFIEHDGGWTLGVARSLVERGQYTSMVSTIVDPVSTSGQSVFDKFDVQASDGRVWFRTSGSSGPATILPMALVLRIAGLGYWGLRLPALLFYALFLLLAATVTYRLSSYGGVVLFFAYLYFFPHLSIFLSYQAIGEMSSMVYILITFLACARLYSSETAPPWGYFGLGLLVGLVLKSKLIGLLSLAGVFALLALQLGVFPSLHLATGRRLGRRDLLAFVAGLCLLPIAWELTQLVTVLRIASPEAYLQHLYQRGLFALFEGSVAKGSPFDWEFILYKFSLQSEIGPAQPWSSLLIFGAALIGGAHFAWRWRSSPHKFGLIALVWSGWLCTTAWFVLIGKTGWVRHYWHGLILEAILLCTVAVGLWSLGSGSLAPGDGARAHWARRTTRAAVAIAVLSLVLWSFLSHWEANGLWIPRSLLDRWQTLERTRPASGLPWIMVSRQDQEAVVDAIKDLPTGANVYYHDRYLAAELPVQTGKITYPIERRYLPPTQPHPQDAVVYASSLVSPWRWPDLDEREQRLDRIRRSCPEILVEDEAYILCTVDVDRQALTKGKYALPLFGEQILLAGASFDPQIIEPGEPATLLLQLRSLRAIEANHSLAVRLVGPDGQVVWDEEGWPSGRPTSSWTPGATWFDSHEVRTPTDLAPGLYRVEVYFVDHGTREKLPVRSFVTGAPLESIVPVGYLMVGEPEPASPGASVAGADFGGEIALVEANVPDPVAVDGAWQVDVGLAWQALTRPQQDYTVFVHLIDSQGKLVAQVDRQPTGGHIPTALWEPGLTLTDDYRLQLPELPAGEYSLLAGLYSVESGQRLPLMGEPHPYPDAVEIGTLQLPPESGGAE